jgi:hypothetical protein
MGDFPLRIDQGNVAFAHSLREFSLKGILEMDITGPAPRLKLEITPVEGCAAKIQGHNVVKLVIPHLPAGPADELNQRESGESGALHQFLFLANR